MLETTIFLNLPFFAAHWFRNHFGVSNFCVVLQVGNGIVTILGVRVGLGVEITLGVGEGVTVGVGEGLSIKLARANPENNNTLTNAVVLFIFKPPVCLSRGEKEGITVIANGCGSFSPGFSPCLRANF